MNPLVSIIVPVYGVDDYLDECLKSIIHQTYSNIEIILCDDGSSDFCGEICDCYTVLDSRIKAVHKKNGGVSSARNAGLDLCSGDYIYFVDSDDMLNLNSIMNFVGCAEESSADIISGSICLIGNSPKKPISVKNGALISSVDYLHLLFDRKVESNARIVAMNKLYKKDLFDGKRFYVGIINEDEELIPQVIYKADNVYMIDNNAYYYRIVDSSITHSSFSLKNLDIITAKRHIVKFFENVGEYDILQGYRVTYLFDLFSLIYELRKSDLPQKTDKIRFVKEEIKRNLKLGFQFADFTDKLRIIKNFVLTFVWYE